MRLNYAILLLGLACFSISSLPAADNNPGFRPKAADGFSNAQKSEGLVLAAEAYTTDDQTKAPFGKLNPNKHGVLPVLLAISNKSGKTVRLDKLRVNYITPDRQTVDAIPPGDVPYITAPNRPKVGVSPIPRLPGLSRDKKNPLAAVEIESRAFAAKILPPGENAHGFVYFQATHKTGAMLYINGIEDAATGKELFFVEIPLEPRN